MAIIMAGSSSWGSTRPFSSARSSSILAWAVTGSSLSSTYLQEVADPELPGRVRDLHRAAHDLEQAGRRSLCFGWTHGSALPVREPDETGVAGPKPRDIIGLVKFLRMKPGHGEVLLAEGDPRVREDEEQLVEEFRRQLDEGMWAAVPVRNPGNGRREAQMVKQYGDIPPDSERVIFFPRASGG